MSQIREEFCEQLDKGNPYDYICKHYYDFTKDELKDIVLECLYPFMSHTHEAKASLLSIKEELEARWDY